MILLDLKETDARLVGPPRRTNELFPSWINQTAVGLLASGCDQSTREAFTEIALDMQHDPAWFLEPFTRKLLHMRAMVIRELPAQTHASNFADVANAQSGSWKTH